MKAACFYECGGIDKLRYDDVPTPSAGPGEVLVRVRAAALNHLDLFVREGLPEFKLPLPFWSGWDIAGDVAQVGPGVRAWRSASAWRSTPLSPAAAASSASRASTASA